MTFQDFSILIIFFIIAFSGIIINIVKKGGVSEIIFEQDGRTLLAFRLVVPAVLVVSVLVYFSFYGHYEKVAQLYYWGYAFVISGLLIRWTAVLSLGDAFTVKVSILKNQSLKTDGIYSKIRHPSYTGLLLYYFGLGLIMQNSICLCLLTIAPLWVVLHRIKQEEIVLNNHFGGTYKSYSFKTWKLLPYVY